MNRIVHTVRSLALLSGLLFSCSGLTDSPGTEIIAQPGKYFPLGDFVLDQISQLEGREVQKVLVIGDRREEVTQRLDREGWAKELDLFIQSDINKASLVDSYTLDETSDQIIHRLIDGEVGDVREMIVRKTDGIVREVSFSYRKENYFYVSEGSGSLVINPETGVLQSYAVSGRQKVWFLPPNKMEVEARVKP